MITLKVKLLCPEARLPTRAHPTDAGFDLYARDYQTLLPGKTEKVPLGVAIAFPEGYVALLWDRSGIGSSGIHRFAGVIDSDYRGEWQVALHNARAAEAYDIRPGDRVVQCVLQKFEPCVFEEVDKLPETMRGEGGFGSTDAPNLPHTPRPQPGHEPEVVEP